jgi:hypothetical protein
VILLCHAFSGNTTSRRGKCRTRNHEERQEASGKSEFLRKGESWFTLMNRFFKKGSTMVRETNPAVPING